MLITINKRKKNINLPSFGRCTLSYDLCYIRQIMLRRTKRSVLSLPNKRGISSEAISVQVYPFYTCVTYIASVVCRMMMSCESHQTLHPNTHVQNILKAVYKPIRFVIF